MIGILAHSLNGVIGSKGKLPWNCKEDLKFFKSTTIGKTIVVGRKTFKHLPPLPDRDVRILTRDPSKLGHHSDYGVSSPEDLPPDTIVCGGAEVYDLLLPHCSEVFVSEINTVCGGDTFFKSAWLETFDQSETVWQSKDCTITRHYRA